MALCSGADRYRLDSRGIGGENTSASDEALSAWVRHARSRRSLAARWNPFWGGRATGGRCGSPGTTLRRLRKKRSRQVRWSRVPAATPTITPLRQTTLNSFGRSREHDTGARLMGPLGAFLKHCFLDRLDVISGPSWRIVGLSRPRWGGGGRLRERVPGRTCRTHGEPRGHRPKCIKKQREISDPHLAVFLDLHGSPITHFDWVFPIF